MSFFRWLVGGALGAAVGIGLWATVVFLTGYEVGLVAAFVGLFVGVGIAAAAGPDRGQGAAIFAGAFALLAVLGGKATCAWIYSQQYMEEMASGPDEITEEYLISCVADEIVAEYEWEGDELDYPAGADLDYPDSQDDYPSDVWADAESRWYELSPDQQQAYRDSVEAGSDVAPLAAFLFALIFSFGLFDFVWIGLAVSSAYKIVRDVPEGAKRQNQPTPLEEPEQAFSFLPGLPPPSTGPTSLQATAPQSAGTVESPFFPGAMPGHDKHGAGDADPRRMAG